MRRRRALPIVPALALAACVGAHDGRGPATAPGTAAATCDAPVTIPEGLIRPGRIVIFGEIHGVRELPAFFGDVVCTVAASGLPVQVGLELPRGEQPIVDAFLRSSGSSSDVTALIAAPFWSKPYQDGRSSRARLDLLDGLRRMRAGWVPVDVFQFDIDSSNVVEGRDESMAVDVGDHARAHPEAVTLILVGEVHSWKTRGAPWDASFLPMAWHLVQDGFDVRSLGRATPDGKAWICTSASASDCSVLPMKAYGSLPSGGSEGIELLPEPDERGYDGMYGTAFLTESLPAAGLLGDGSR